MQYFLKLVFGSVAVAAIIVFLALTMESYIATDEITVTVTKREKFETDDGEIYYHLHTNKGIFLNRNSTFHRKDNALTIAKTLKRNNKYKIKVVGYDFGVEIPLFFKYKNIVAVIDGPHLNQDKTR